METKPSQEEKKLLLFTPECVCVCYKRAIVFIVDRKCVWVCVGHAALQLHRSLKQRGAELTLTRFPGIYFDQRGPPGFIAVSRLRL